MELRPLVSALSITFLYTLVTCSELAAISKTPFIIIPDESREYSAFLENFKLEGSA